MKTRNDDKRGAGIEAVVAEHGGEEVLAAVNQLMHQQPKLAAAMPSVICALVDAGHGDAREALRPLLSEDGVERSNAVREIVYRLWQDDFLDEIVAFVEKAASRKRSLPHGISEGLAALGASRSPRAEKLLRDIIQAGIPLERTRADAVAALANKQRAKDRALFRKLAKDDPSWEVRMMARLGLAKLGDEKALLSLRADLADEDLDVARTAAIELERWLGIPYTIPTLDNYRKRCAWWDKNQDRLLEKFRKLTS